MAVVRYLVDDVEKAVAFYAGQLGFTLEQQMGSAFALVSQDGLQLWLSGPQSSAARSSRQDVRYRSRKCFAESSRRSRCRASPSCRKEAHSAQAAPKGCQYRQSRSEQIVCRRSLYPDPASTFSSQIS